MDYNAITHTPPMVCNAARIELAEKPFFLFGKKENTPSVVRLIGRIDRERMAIGKALGLKQWTLEEEIMMVKWNPNGENYVLPLYDAIHTPFLEVCEGPYKLHTRHLEEDIPYGLVTYSSLGKMLGVPTPVTDAIITLSEELLQKDCRAIGRTVESMGIDPRWSKETVKRYLRDGTIGAASEGEEAREEAAAREGQRAKAKNAKPAAEAGAGEGKGEEGMSDLKGRDLKGIADVSKEEIECILEVSKLLKLEQKMGRPHRLLEGKTLAGIFETPSTRTSISFETAMTQLGGHMIYLSEHRMWVGLAAEEDWHDTIMTIDRYVDAIAHRAVTRPSLEKAAELATIPLINASCPVEHPCQAFADVMTMQEKKGSLQKAKVAFCWGYRTANPPAGLDQLPMLMAGKLGFDMVIACPEGFEPDMGSRPSADKAAAVERRQREDRPLLRGSREGRGLHQRLLLGVARGVREGARDPLQGRSRVRREEEEAREGMVRLEEDAVDGPEGLQGDALPARVAQQRGHGRGPELAAEHHLRRGREPAAHREGHPRPDHGRVPVARPWDGLSGQRASRRTSPSRYCARGPRACARSTSSASTRRDRGIPAGRCPSWTSPPCCSSTRCATTRPTPGGRGATGCSSRPGTRPRPCTSPSSRPGTWPRSRPSRCASSAARARATPTRRSCPGVEVSSGSLGQGLGIAAGCALAGRMAGAAWRVYCVMGDGEQQEGSIWEAAMAAAHYRLDNLCAIVDKNRLQIDGPVSAVMDIDPLADKYRAFGWNVIDVDGHDIGQLQEAFRAARAAKGQPTVIIADTIKGKGVSFMENQAGWHGVATKGLEQLDQALRGDRLARVHARARAGAARRGGRIPEARRGGARGRAAPLRPRLVVERGPRT